MGSSAIDPHSHKVQTKLDKIRKFGVNRPKSKHEKCQIYKEMYGHPDAVRHSRPDALHFFVNFEVLKSLYLSQNWPD